MICETDDDLVHIDGPIGIFTRLSMDMSIILSMVSETMHAIDSLLYSISTIME